VRRETGHTQTHDKLTVDKGTDSLELRVQVGRGLTRGVVVPLDECVSLDAHGPCEKIRFTISKGNG